jgi:hypothetical protein
LRPPSYYSDTKRICDLALAKAKERTTKPTPAVPAALCHIASKRTCDPALANRLRQQEAAEGRKLQTGKKNKIPDPQQKD